MNPHRKHQLIAAAVGIPLLVGSYFAHLAVQDWEHDNVYQPACERACRARSLEFSDVTRPARRASGLARCRCHGGDGWKTLGVRGYSDNGWIDWAFTTGIWFALGAVLTGVALVTTLVVLRFRAARREDSQSRGQ